MGAYYVQESTGAAYKCEATNDYRALLYLCQRRIDEADNPIRLRPFLDEFSDWRPVTSTFEFSHLDVIYNYKLREEYAHIKNPQDGILRRQYHIDKYLQHIHPDEKMQRFRDAIGNLSWIEPDGTGGQLSAIDGAMRFYEVLAHLHEDAKLSGYSPETYADEYTQKMQIGEYLRSKYPDSASLFKKLPDTKVGGIFKLGKAEHARQLYYSGQARLQLATAYMKSEHNAAVQDQDEDKIVIRVSRDGRNLVILSGDETIIQSHETDQMLALELPIQFHSYLFCTSKLIDPQLFVEFDYDAYVFIPNDHIHEFANRLNKATKGKIPKSAGLRGHDVTYYDPLRVVDEIPNAFNEPLLVERFKDFRYEYQREYRFIFPSVARLSELPEYIDVEMGSIEDIAELFVI